MYRPSALTLRTDHDSAAAQVHFWSTPQAVACAYATLLTGMHLGSMPYRSKQFWGRAFSFSPDGLSEEMAEDRPAFCPHQLPGPLDARPATAADSTTPGTTAKANPELGLPSGKEHGSRSRPYPVRAHVSDLRFQLRSHPALPPCLRPSVANQRPGCPVPECIPLRSWVDPCSCPLPKPWPCSLALQSHISQERTDQVRSLLSPPITEMPLRRQACNAQVIWP